MLRFSENQLMATPAKCGSSRFYYLQKRFPEFATRERKKHDGFQPKNYEGNVRILVVRNPIDRFVSLFNFFLHTQTSSKTLSSRGWVIEKNFTEFTRFFIECKFKGAMWRTPGEYLTTYDPTHIVRLEDIDCLWKIIGSKFKKEYWKTSQRKTPYIVTNPFESKVSPEFSNLVKQEYSLLRNLYNEKETRIIKTKST